MEGRGGGAGGAQAVRGQPIVGGAGACFSTEVSTAISISLSYIHLYLYIDISI